MNRFPLQTVPVAGFHEVALHLGGQYFVPVALRLPVEQLPRVRVWVSVFPLHTVLAAGAQPVSVQLGGQDRVPLTVRWSVLQSDRVRV